MIKRNLLTIAMLDAIEKSDKCPLCYLWAKSEEHYMKHLLTNEVVMSPEFRGKVLAAKGFCNRHMHLLYKTAYSGHTENGLGYALCMQVVVKRIIEQFESLPLHNLRKRKRKQAFSLLCNMVEQVVQGQQPCPACEHLQSLDEMHLHTLVQMLNDKDFREKFESSRGLCLPHFVSAIRMIGEGKLKNPDYVTQTLIEVEIKHLQLVEHLLSEFARKQSWDFRNELTGQEANANLMVLNLLVGVEGLYNQSHKAMSFPRKID